MDTAVSKFPIRCHDKAIIGQVFFHGCLLPNCVADPSLIKMTVKEINTEREIRSQETDFIRPDLMPLTINGYFSLQRGETCEQLEFSFIRMFDPLSRLPFICKFQFTT